MAEDTNADLDVYTDGGSHVRVSPNADTWMVSDGVHMLLFDRTGNPRYQRRAVPAGQVISFVFHPGNAEFDRVCPGAQHIGTETMIGRAAVGYQCGTSTATSAQPEQSELWLDATSGVMLKRLGAASRELLQATAIETEVAEPEDFFSTDIPAGAATATTAPQTIQPFTLERIGGGELTSNAYTGHAVVIVSSTDERDLRLAIGRVTKSGARPIPVIGVLVVADATQLSAFQGSILNVADRRRYVDNLHLGPFPIPVGVAFKVKPAPSPITNGPVSIAWIDVVTSAGLVTTSLDAVSSTQAQIASALDAAS